MATRHPGALVRDADASSLLWHVAHDVLARVLPEVVSDVCALIREVPESRVAEIATDISVASDSALKRAYSGRARGQKRATSRRKSSVALSPINKNLISIGDGFRLYRVAPPKAFPIFVAFNSKIPKKTPAANAAAPNARNAATASRICLGGGQISCVERSRSSIRPISARLRSCGRFLPVSRNWARSRPRRRARNI